jgi:hypothetical protein
MDMGEEQEEGQAAEEPVDEVMDMDDDDVPDFFKENSSFKKSFSSHILARFSPRPVSSSRTWRTFSRTSSHVCPGEKHPKTEVENSGHEL